MRRRSRAAQQGGAAGRRSRAAQSRARRGTGAARPRLQRMAAVAAAVAAAAAAAAAAGRPHTAQRHLGRSVGLRLGVRRGAMGKRFLISRCVDRGSECQGVRRMDLVLKTHGVAGRVFVDETVSGVWCVDLAYMHRTCEGEPPLPRRGLGARARADESSCVVPSTARATLTVPPHAVQLFFESGRHVQPSSQRFGVSGFSSIARAASANALSQSLHHRSGVSLSLPPSLAAYAGWLAPPRVRGSFSP